MITTVFGRSTHVFGARDSLPNTAQIMEAAKTCDKVFMPPSAWEEVAKSETWLEQLSRLKHIQYGGGIWNFGITYMQDYDLMRCN